MKLKTLASLFKQSKHLTVHKADDGGQWISCGGAMYLINGIPNLTPDIVLRIFDIPPDKRGDWNLREDKMPELINFEDSVADEYEVTHLETKIHWHGKTYLLFHDGGQINSVNIDLVKPLFDDPEYLSYHRRDNGKGGFVLACKSGLQLVAVILPTLIHADPAHADEIFQIADCYRHMSEEGGSTP